jgi:hypothetical protein
VTSEKAVEEPANNVASSGNYEFVGYIHGIILTPVLRAPDSAPKKKKAVGLAALGSHAQPVVGQFEFSWIVTQEVKIRLTHYTQSRFALLVR